MKITKLAKIGSDEEYDAVSVAAFYDEDEAKPTYMLSLTTGEGVSSSGIGKVAAAQQDDELAAKLRAVGLHVATI